MSKSTADTTRANASGRTLELIRRHPLVSYFVLAYGITWGGVALVVGPLGLSDGALMVVLLVAMATGPTTASLLLTGILDGAAGYRDLLARLTRWRAAPRWYAAALLLNPIAILVVLGALSLASPVYLPGVLTSQSPLARSLGFETVSPLLMMTIAIAVGLVAGFFEELGWTGFATPRLIARHGCLAAGAGLGLLWATWHIVGDVPGTAAAWGDQWPWRVLTWMYAGMVPYRVLMTWVYRHTRSVLLGILMHMAYTSGQALLQPGAAGNTESLVWWGLLGVALSVIVGAVALADRAHLVQNAASKRSGRRNELPARVSRTFG